MLADGSLQLPLLVESRVEREHLMGLIVHSCDLGMCLVHLGVFKGVADVLFLIHSVQACPPHQHMSFDRLFLLPGNGVISDFTMFRRWAQGVMQEFCTQVSFLL